MNGTKAQAQGRKGLGLGAALALGGLFSALSLGLALAFAHGAVRIGLAAGFSASALGGLVGLVLVGMTLDKAIQLSVAAMGAGFLLRVLLVGGGLALTMGPLHGEPLAFAASFFPLFFVFVGLELGLLATRRRPAGASPGNPQHA